MGVNSGYTSIHGGEGDAVIKYWVSDGSILARTHAPSITYTPVPYVDCVNVRATTIRTTVKCVILFLKKNASRGLTSVAVRVDPRIAHEVAVIIQKKIKGVVEISVDHYADRDKDNHIEDTQLHVSLCVFC